MGGSGANAISSASAAAGALLIHAWPDRVAKARGERGRFVLANGRGAMLDAADPLAGEEFLVVADLQGKAQNARIASAAAVDGRRHPRSARRAHLETPHRDCLRPRKARVRVRETERLGAIVLVRAHAAGADRRGGRSRHPRRHPRSTALSLLPWSKEAETLRHRLSWLHRGLGAPWPDVSDAALIASLDDWLLPFLSGEASFARIDPAPSTPA